MFLLGPSSESSVPNSYVVSRIGCGGLRVGDMRDGKGCAVSDGIIHEQ